MRFYVNEVYTPDEYSDRKIGLFSSNAWSGTGDITGRLRKDFYRDTKLLAQGIQLNAKDGILNYNLPFDGGVQVFSNPTCERIRIKHKKCERILEAPDEETAVALFRMQAF